MSRVVDERAVGMLTSEVKRSRKFRSVADHVVRDLVLSSLRASKPLNVLKKRYRDRVVKSVRSKLHGMYASFYKENIFSLEQKIRGFMARLSQENIKKVLLLHASTKERLPYYEEFYNLVFRGMSVKSVLDVGCGFHPFSFPLSGVKHVEYIGMDVGVKEGELLSEFFTNPEFGVRWEYACENVLSDAGLNALKKLKSVDVCFMLKVSDCLDVSHHKNTEAVLRAVNAKRVILSFSKKTLSGLEMRHPGRGWVDRMLDRLKYAYEEMQLGNEIIYIVKKGF